MSIGPSAITTMPLFPLNTILFPGGQLQLNIFEPRYLEMSKACMRDDSVFGICPIRDGSEAGVAAAPFHRGCSARIIDFNVTTPGLISLVVRGEQAFDFESCRVAPSGLLRAEVRLRPPLPPSAIPAQFARLSLLLGAFIAKVGAEHFSAPIQLDDAGWVAGRLIELLPLEVEDKVRLLSFDDPVELLRELDRLVVIESV